MYIKCFDAYLICITIDVSLLYKQTKYENLNKNKKHCHFTSFPFSIWENRYVLG